MASDAHNRRKNRESLKKRLGSTGCRIVLRDLQVSPGCIYCQRTREQCPYIAKDGTQKTHALQLDHLTAESAGGLDIATNLVVCCIYCNSAKQGLTLAEWCRVIRCDSARIRAHARRVLPEIPRRSRVYH